MVKVDEPLILKLQTLARLQLSDDERANLMVDLEAVLSMVEKLDEVNTEGVLPLVHIVAQPHDLREDLIKDQLSSDESISNAPEKEAPYFKVPKVIDRS